MLGNIKVLLKFAATRTFNKELQVDKDAILIFEPGCPKGQAFNCIIPGLCDTKLRDRGASIKSQINFKNVCIIEKVIR